MYQNKTLIQSMKFDADLRIDELIVLNKDKNITTENNKLIEKQLKDKQSELEMNIKKLG